MGIGHDERDLRELDTSRKLVIKLLGLVFRVN